MKADFIKRFLILLFVAIAVFIVLAIATRSATLSQLQAEIRQSGIYIDENRVPDSILKTFLNDNATIIATVGLTNQSIDTIILSSDSLEYGLPVDYHLFQALLISDELETDLNKSLRQVLQYLHPTDFGKQATYGTTGKIEQFTIFTNKIQVDKYTDFDDTLFLWYYSKPSDMTDSNSVLDLDDKYIPLLKSLTKNNVIERIEFIPKDESKTFDILKIMTESLLGRKSDEK